MTSSEQLERDTQSCRDQLADTLDELRARMSPGEVVDQLVDYAQDTTGGLFFQHLKQQVANNQARFAAFPSTRSLYLPGGAPPAPGTVFRNPDLADTYAQLERQVLVGAQASAKQTASR